MARRRTPPPSVGSVGGNTGSSNICYQSDNHYGGGPKGCLRSDDRIKEDVNEHPTRQHEVDASEIEVDVKNGEVTLKGTVDHRQANAIAEDVAEQVSGVREVHNQIRVKTANDRPNSCSNLGQSGSGSSTNRF